MTRAPAMTASSPTKVFIVAGESSGDQLGAALMQALVRLAGGPLRISGVGGPRMADQGLTSLFPMSDIAVMGFGPVVRRLPLLLRRIAETAEAVAAARPDVLVLIDSPDFNQRVARRLRRRLPSLPIVNYVSPTVWAWRPGRAAKLRPLVDHLLALLPFEPAAHERLGGPPCTYVGHPLMERLDDFLPSDHEAAERLNRPTLLILPGSRRSEITKLDSRFAQCAHILHRRFPGLRMLLPTVPHVADLVRQRVAMWPVRPDVITGESEKLAAFRCARAAIAASGTVTLELALADVPMAVAYRVGYVEGEIARRLLTISVASLPNLIVGEPIVPEFIEWGWTGDTLAHAVAPLIEESPARTAQLAGFRRVRDALKTDRKPSEMAAQIVLAHAKQARAVVAQP